MSLEISYMGTKKKLAPLVSDIISETKNGAILDAFSGMCAIGKEQVNKRNVWNNDTQVFAHEYAKALFTTNEQPLSLEKVAQLHRSLYEQKTAEISRLFLLRLEAEKEALESKDYSRYQMYYDKFSLPLAVENGVYLDPYCLFSSLYADTYFGLMQCIEIDSIYYSIEYNTRNKIISKQQSLWLLLALGKALLKASNTTGHFAQYLALKPKTFNIFLRQRKKSIWEKWLSIIPELTPLGYSGWRANNKSFNSNCLELMKYLHTDKLRPAVVYADPPYTDDQYSRYYHILETLLLYDYPKTNGKARYRANRFTTPFSLKSKVRNAFEELVGLARRLNSELILSYPSNGLLFETGTSPDDILNKYYKSVKLCSSVSNEHSTFGASKGFVKTKAIEFIYWAKP